MEKEKSHAMEMGKEKAQANEKKNKKTRRGTLAKTIITN